jgi:uncharacterized membrane protein
MQAPKMTLKKRRDLTGSRIRPDYLFITLLLLLATTAGVRNFLLLVDNQFRP